MATVNIREATIRQISHIQVTGERTPEEASEEFVPINADIFFLPVIGYSERATQIGSLPIQDTDSKTFRIEKALNELHHYQVEIPEPVKVRDYLSRYPDLANLLPFVCRVALERLGVETELSLEVYHDPEIEDVHLALYIRQKTYDENLLDIIKEIRKQYSSYLTRVSGWLHLTTDFCPPKAKK